MHADILRQDFDVCPQEFTSRNTTILCFLPAVSSATFKVNGTLVREENEVPFFIAGNRDGERFSWDIPRRPVSIECIGKDGDTIERHGRFHCDETTITSLVLTPPAEPSPTSTSSLRSTPTPTASTSHTSTPSSTLTARPTPTSTASPSSTLLPSSTSNPTSTPSPASSTSPSSTPISSATPRSSAKPRPSSTSYPTPESTPPSSRIAKAKSSPADDEKSGTSLTESAKYKVTFEKVEEKYPIYVFEAGGSILRSGNETSLVVYGGFYGFPNITSAVYSRKFGVSSDANWTKLEDLPSPHATHMAQAVDGDVIYFVGGFIGTYPGVSGKRAFGCNTQKKKYFDLADIPDTRAGGGLLITRKDEMKTLVYSGGVVRDANFTHTDYGTTWALNISNKGAKWMPAETMADARNHMGAATTCGRHIFVGGQHTIGEETGNSAVVSEYLPVSRTWPKQPPAPLPIPLGHISASILPYKCGLIVIGGITNGRKLSDAVYYWDSASDTWSPVGTYLKSRSRA